MKRLKSLDIWTHCRKTKTSDKAPAVGLGKTKPISYIRARENATKQIAGSSLLGIVFQETSEYIGIDVDVDPTGKKKNATKKIPQELLFFLSANPTHVHFSPSGTGLHILYKIDKQTQKELNNLNLNQGATSIDKGDLFKGDWRYRNSFLTITENLHPLSTSEISTISFVKLLELIPSIQPKEKSKLKKETNNESVKYEVIESIPNLKDLKELLETLPATFNSQVKKACDQLPYSKPNSNYEYWVLVGCACAHHAITLEIMGNSRDSSLVYGIFLNWCKQDTEGYEGDEIVLEKFSNLLSTTQTKIDNNVPTVTIGMLKLLDKLYTINFPDMILRGAGKNKKLFPDPASLKNLKILMKHENLELVFDPMGGGMCFKGPEETITKWFCPAKTYYANRPYGYGQVLDEPALAAIFQNFMQNKYKFSVAKHYAAQAIDLLCTDMQYENAFTSWITKSPWDGESRLEEVCNSITFSDKNRDNHIVYKSYIRMSLLSTIGIHFWPEDEPKIPAILVLSGPEYTYKSSWAEWLLPKDMSNYNATASVDVVTTGGRDWELFLSTKAIVVLNECEPLFQPKYEQKIKSSVDSASVTFRNIYGRRQLTRPRTALIIGTTNKTNLFTGSSGTRKIWQIPVAECDSMLIKNMDHQQLYAEIYHILQEYKKDNPNELIQNAWGLEFELRQQINDLNTRMKGDDIGVLGLLHEVFGHPLDLVFDESVYVKTRGLKVEIGRADFLDEVVQTNTDIPNAWTPTQMLKYLRQRFPNDRIDRTGVKYALEEYAGIFTKSTNKPIIPFTNYRHLPDRAKYKEIFRGVLNMGSEKYFIMPKPLIREQN
jgi:hypothetical protein